MIPNTLWQTWKTKTAPKALRPHQNSWWRTNPHMEYHLVDDEQAADFILEHFGPDVHFRFMTLPQPIMRADFWRIAVVYIHGGYYADLDMRSNANLKHVVREGVDAVFMREVNNIANYFFGAVPRHPVFKLALDYMIDEMTTITDKGTQSFGMHSLHRAVREYYQVIDTNYVSDDRVEFLLDADVRAKDWLIHDMASIRDYDEYESWRARDQLMLEEREQANDILFFTTFNANGYELYGRKWVETFIMVANYYNKFHAKIYYEGFDPDIVHPNIHWIEFDRAIPSHRKWKRDFLSKSSHSDYVRTMTVRFSHKAFVIQHVLDTHTDPYLIWLDGDCVFKNADYTDGFPANLLGDKFLACQLEHAHVLHHVESGILIFDGQHPDTKTFNEEFKKWYQVDHLIGMGEPYDGFLVYKSLLTTSLEYVNLNEKHGAGGIQSDPNLTFLHPEIKSRFIHNIGWTGKHQYVAWSDIRERDEIYRKMKRALFGGLSEEEIMEKQQKARTKLKMILAGIKSEDA